MPKVSVLLAAYRKADHLHKAVESILCQTFKDFELIIVNSGSSAKAVAILDSFSDKRIKIIRWARPLNQTHARNLGLKHAHGKYVAMMDSDDVSLPGRFAKQVRYLERHPEIGILGGHVDIIDQNGTFLHTCRLPADPGFVQWSLLTGDACLCNPALMMRRSLMKRLGGYRKHLTLAEDFDFWVRALAHTQLSNLPEVLLRKRIWGGQTSFRRAQEERKVITEAMHTAITKLLRKPVDLKTVSHFFWLEIEIALADYRAHTRLDRMILRYAQRLKRGIALRNFQQIESTAHLTRDLLRAHLRLRRFSQQQKRQITMLAWRALYALARTARKLNIPKEKIGQLLRG